MSESPESPIRCKSMYDNNVHEWNKEVYYPFQSAYNNNKASVFILVHW